MEYNHVMLFGRVRVGSGGWNHSLVDERWWIDVAVTLDRVTSTEIPASARI